MGRETPRELSETLRRHVLKGIAAGADLEPGLCVARDYGFLLQKFDFGRLADPELEAALLNLFLEQGMPTADDVPCDDLHVASELYDLGGHTKLLENLAQSGQAHGRRQRVLITRSATERHQALMAEQGIAFTLAQGTETERARAVVRAGLSAKCVILHIHPDDIGAAIAAAALRRAGVRVLFVNHADHSFVFGSSAADVVLEISGTGWDLTRRHRPHEAQSFIGIPIRPLFDTRHPAPDPIITSVGSNWKYEPSGQGPSFQDIVRHILDRCPARLDMVGPTGEEPCWQALKAAHPDRVQFHGPTAYEKMCAILSQATCYIDSMPVTGGTIFSEAAMSGLPVFGMETDLSGYTLLDQIRYATQDALVEAVVTCCVERAPVPGHAATLEKLSTIARVDAVADRFMAARDGRYETLPDELLRKDAKPFTKPLDYFEQNRLTFLTKLVQPMTFELIGPRAQGRFVWEILRADGFPGKLRSKLRVIKQLYGFT